MMVSCALVWLYAKRTRHERNDCFLLREMFILVFKVG